MYSSVGPKIDKDLIPLLLQLSKEFKIPLTQFVNDILRNYIRTLRKNDLFMKDEVNKLV